MKTKNQIPLSESGTCESGAFLSEDMQNPQSQQINKRFFLALDELIKTKRIKSLFAFVKRYELNRRNLDRLRDEPQREFQLCYLTWLATDFGVSSQWLLTGEGDMFSRRLVAQKTTGSIDPAVSNPN